MFRTHTVSSKHVEKESLYLDNVLYDTCGWSLLELSTDNIINQGHYFIIQLFPCIYGGRTLIVVSVGPKCQLPLMRGEGTGMTREDEGP